MPASESPSLGLRALASAVRIYLAMWLILWGAQEFFLFPPAFLPWGEGDPEAAYAFEVVDVPNGDGFVRVYWKRAGADRAVLFSHGNGETCARAAWMTIPLSRAQWGFACVEYRGYTGVPGWPTQEGLGADLVVAWRWLQDAQGMQADRIVLHGRSMGGGVVGEALKTLEPPGVVLEHTFDSARAVAAGRFPMYPVSRLIRHPFDTAATLRGRDLPVFQVHGTADTVVPYPRAEALRDALSDVSFHAVQGGEHTPSALYAQRELRHAWLAWLEETVPRG